MTRIRSGQITSQTATDGYVLTADGSGGAVWEVTAATATMTAAALEALGVRGEILIEDGSSSPPVMLTNEAEDDFLYANLG